MTGFRFEAFCIAAACVTCSLLAANGFVWESVGLSALVGLAWLVGGKLDEMAD